MIIINGNFLMVGAIPDVQRIFGTWAGFIKNQQPVDYDF